MHADHEVISHGFGLPQLVGVTVVHHVITVGQEETAKQLLYCTVILRYVVFGWAILPAVLFNITLSCSLYGDLEQ